MNTFVSRSTTMSHFVFILCGFEYFGSNPASDLQTKTLVLHYTGDTVSDNENHSHLQVIHRLIHSNGVIILDRIGCNTMVYTCQIVVFCV
jgi:hypothetical protein